MTGQIIRFWLNFKAIAIAFFLIASALGSSIGLSTSNHGFSVRNDGQFLVITDGSNIEVTISPHNGGELTGLKVLYQRDWHELIYRARDYVENSAWRGKALVLWPATGVSIDADGQKNQYSVAGSNYPMPFHGFAKQSAWQVIDKIISSHEAGVALGFSSSESTRQYYPFDFNLQVEYRVSKDGLRITYTLIAASSNVGPMPYSMGNHIAFNVPMIAGSPARSTRFDSELPHILVVNDERIYTGERIKSPFSVATSVDVLPKRRSISLGGAGKIAQLSVIDPSGFQIQIEHGVQEGPTSDAVDFNLWADVDEGFFSPQPWVGAQNSLNSGFGLMQLEPGNRWQWQIDIKPVSEHAPTAM